MLVMEPSNYQLQQLQLDYVDLYLIHTPFAAEQPLATTISLISVLVINLDRQRETDCCFYRNNAYHEIEPKT